MDMEFSNSSNINSFDAHQSPRDHVSLAALPQEVVVPKLIAPYPQPALRGGLGLTDGDIADGLGTRLKHLVQKIVRGQLLEMLNFMKLRYSSSEEYNENGRLVTRWIFSAEAAEVIVSKWDNEAGWTFHGFLYSCRKAVPLMAAEILELRSKIAALTQPKLRIKGSAVVSFIKRAHTDYDCYGKPFSFVVTAKKKVRDLTPEERDAYDKQVCARSMNGQAAKVHDIVSRGECDDEAVKEMAQEASKLMERLNAAINRPGAVRIREGSEIALHPTIVRRRCGQLTVVRQAH